MSGRCFLTLCVATVFHEPSLRQKPVIQFAMNELEHRGMHTTARALSVIVGVVKPPARRPAAVRKLLSARGL